jgi:hypothetical protein
MSATVMRRTTGSTLPETDGMRVSLDVSCLASLTQAIAGRALI